MKWRQRGLLGVLLGLMVPTTSGATPLPPSTTGTSQSR